MNYDEEIDRAIAAALTHFAMHQNLRQQPISEESLDQYISEGLQKNAVNSGRSIFALVDDRDHAYFGQSQNESDQFGNIDERTRAVFGRSYAAEPDVLVRQLAEDEAIAEADTLLLTVPNQLGVEYCVHTIEAVLKHVAPQLGWR